MIFATAAVWASSPVSLAVRVASATVPAGGTAQIQIFLAAPTTIVCGEIVMDLDPTVFGSILSADVFSLTGDQVGSASIQGQHLDVVFFSQTGGIGQEPNLPVLVMAVPVLPGVEPGTTSAVTFQSGASQPCGAGSGAVWTDTHSVQYAVAPMPGTITVNGSLSIQAVTPGGGTLPQGATISIAGAGFTAGTTVQVDGVSIASTQFVSPQQINLTLGGSADLTAKRISVQNPGGATAIFFSALRGSYVHRPSSGPLATIQPILPLTLYAAARAGNCFDCTAGIALQNPSQSPVEVTIEAVTLSLSGVDTVSTLVTLPPDAVYVESVLTLGASLQAFLEIVPSVPIRMATVDSGVAGLVIPTAVPTTQMTVFLDGTVQFLDSNDPLVFHWAAGSTSPAPQVLDGAFFGTPALSFTVTSATQTGSGWLSVSPSQGITCYDNGFGSPATCPAASKVNVTVDPSNLGAGVYNGVLTFTSSGLNPQPAAVPVILNVDAQPLLFVDLASAQFSDQTTDPIQSRTVHVTSNAGPLGFSLTASTQSGKNWLTVTPQQGTTPATFTIMANPAASGGSSDTGVVTVKGPNNTQTIAVSLAIAPPVSPPAIATSPASLQFSVQTGQPAPAEQVAISPEFVPFTLATETTDGANWLSAAAGAGPGPQGITVSVDPTNLTAGTYHGVVTITSAAAASPGQVPVTLTVWNAPPPPVSANPSSLSFTAASGGSSLVSQTISVTSGSVPLSFSISVSTTDGANWLKVAPPTGPITSAPMFTPGTAAITAYPGGLAPGVYSGTLTIGAPPGSTNTATVAVTFTVTPAPPPLPQQGAIPIVTAVLNGASQEAGTVAPGEIFSIFGQNIGPATPAGFALGSNGKVATNLGGVQVLFDGLPAPLLYTSATQINAIVPYEVAGQSATNVVVNFSSLNIPAGGVPVTASAPAIFTLDFTGQGGGAVRNQDNSVNTPANPAPRGSIVQIYATGQGVTSPPGVTGEITGTSAKKPLLPVSVQIGGIDAQVMYAGSAPEEISGLVQVNAVVPLNTAVGPSVPVILRIGTALIQSNVTIAVE